MSRIVKTSSGESLKLKVSFKKEQDFGVVYTGGKLVVSSDESFLVSSCGDVIKILDQNSGRQISAIHGGADTFTCFALSPKDDIIATAGRSLLLKIWKRATSECVQTLKAPEGPISSMSFHSGGALLATGSAEGSIKVWDIRGGFITHNLKGSQGVVGMVRFHPGDDFFLLFSSAEIDCKIRIWNLKTPKKKTLLDGHVGMIPSLSFSSNLKYVFSAGRDNVVNMWSLKDYQLVKTFPVYESLEGIVVLPSKYNRLFTGLHKDAHLFVTAGSKGTFKLWESHSGECILEQAKTLDVMPAYIYLQFLPRQSRLVAVTYDHNILFFDLPKMNLRKQLIGFNDEIVDVKFADPKGDYFVIATNSEQMRCIQRNTNHSNLLVGHTDMVISIDIFANYTMLVSGSKDNTCRVWRLCQDHIADETAPAGEHPAETTTRDTNPITFECIGICEGHTEGVGAVCGSRKDGSFIVSASQDRTLKLWSLQPLWDSLPPHQAHPQNQPAKPIHVSSKFTQKAHDKDINTLAVSPNDCYIVSGSQDKLAKVWSSLDMSLVGVARGHKRGIWCAQFSPVDKIFATASGDKTIKIWSLADFSCLRTFEGHTNSVLKLEFITKGMQLVSSGSDGLCKLWTIKTNECVHTLDGHSDKVWGLSVSQDELRIISVGGDSTVNVWQDFTEAEDEILYAQEELRLQKDQELENILALKDYRKAFSLALSLRKPHRMLIILESLMETKEEFSLLDSLVKTFSRNQLLISFSYIREWNTNSRNSTLAQEFLHALLRNFSPRQLINLLNPKTKPRPQPENSSTEDENRPETALEQDEKEQLELDFKELIETLIPYTQRHLERRTRLVQQSSFVDYVWKNMKFVDVDEKTGEGEDIPVKKQRLDVIDR